MIGGAIAKGRAAREVAAAGGNVTVIQLDAITSLETRKSKGIGGWLAGRSLLVTTADGATYGFSVKLDKWSADLTSALTARGREVHPMPQGMTVALAPSGDGPPW
jgi:predicted NAD/FAD-dependent oxidoreductase